MTAELVLRYVWRSRLTDDQLTIQPIEPIGKYLLHVLIGDRLEGAAESHTIHNDAADSIQLGTGHHWEVDVFGRIAREHGFEITHLSSLFVTVMMPASSSASIICSIVCALVSSTSSLATASEYQMRM